MKKILSLLIAGMMVTGLSIASADKECCSSKDKKETSCSSKSTASNEKKSEKADCGTATVANSEKAGCCTKEAKGGNDKKEVKKTDKKS